MAIEKLDKSELYGFPGHRLETATAEETAGGITLPVIVVSNGVLTYKVVATKTWSDYVATTTEDAISAANAKVDAAVKDSQAKTAAAVNLPTTRRQGLAVRHRTLRLRQRPTRGPRARWSN